MSATLFGEEFTAPEDEERQYVELTTAEKERITGYYYFPPEQANVHIFLEDGKLFLQPDHNPAFPMNATSDSTFFLDQGISLTFQFIPEGKAKAANVLMGGMETVITSIDPPKMEEKEVASTAVDFTDYTGIYYSTELDTHFELWVEDGELKAEDLHHGPSQLVSRGPDRFADEVGVLNELEFIRDADGEVSGFTVGFGPRVRKLRFTRL